MKAILIIDVEQGELELLDEYKKQNMIVDIGYDYDETQGWFFARRKLLSLKPMPQKHMTEKENMSSTCIKWYDKGYNRCIDEILEDEQ